MRKSSSIITLIGLLLFTLSSAFGQIKPMETLTPLPLSEILKLPEKSTFLHPDPFGKNNRNCSIVWQMAPVITGGIPADMDSTYMSNACMCDAPEQHVHQYMGQWFIAPKEACYCSYMQFIEPPKSTFSIFL